MDYSELILTLEERHAEQVADWLIEQEIQFQQSDQETINAPALGQVKIHIFVEPSLLEQTKQLLMNEFDGKDIISWDLVKVIVHKEEMWRDRWKEFFKVRHMGKFAIVPSWEKDNHEPRPQEITLHLDPGRAFGTGAHETTRLCLTLLSEISLPSHAKILDVGCGSGVLAIGALLMDSNCHAVGIDIDHEAIDTTYENATLNQVQHRMEVSTTPLAEIKEKFDLIFANLTSPTLIFLGERLITPLKKDGIIIISGLLNSEVGPVVEKFKKLGCYVVKEIQEGEWSALQLALEAIR